MFRKVGAFVYVMSALVSMESCLSDPAAKTIETDHRVQEEEGDPSCTSPPPPQTQWTTLPAQEILRLLHLIFNTLCVAMRYEPANAKFFQQEVRSFLD